MAVSASRLPQPAEEPDARPRRLRVVAGDEADPPADEARTWFRRQLAFERTLDRIRAEHEATTAR